MFIFGYPIKDSPFQMPAKERIYYFKQFLKNAPLDTLQVLLPIPLPGTDLRQRLKKEQRLFHVEDIGWEYYDGNFILFEPDKPLTAEEMQDVNKKIMGKFYKFKYMFVVGLNIFTFPGLLFYLHNIKLGWRKWYRYWHLYIVRFGGWITIKGWYSRFKKDDFKQKLQQARKLRSI